MPPATPAQIAAVHSLIHITPRMLAYDDAQIAIGLAYPLIDLALLVIILGLGWASKIGAAATRWGRNPFWAAFLFWVLLHVVTGLLLLPLGFYSGYVLEHRYGMSAQPLTGWISDWAKGWAVDTVVGALIAAGCMMVIRRSPKRWPLIFAAIMVPIIAFGIFVEPLVIEPMFNRFTVMPASNPLRAPLMSLAARAGIRDVQIFVVDKSKQTNETNAYVDGLGPSARIVIWDTVIAKMPPKQVMAIAGHEMGHYVEHHVVYGFLVGSVGLFVLFPLIRLVTLAALARFGPRWGIGSLADPAALAALLLVFNLAMLVIALPAAATSRYIEHRADAFGLAVTGDRVTFAEAFVKLGSDNLDNPYPPRWVAVLGDHPPLGERIDFALTGQPRDIWPPLALRLPARPASETRAS